VPNEKDAWVDATKQPKCDCWRCRHNLPHIDSPGADSICERTCFLYDEAGWCEHGFDLKSCNAALLERLEPQGEPKCDCPRCSANLPHESHPVPSSEVEAALLRLEDSAENAGVLWDEANENSPASRAAFDDALSRCDADGDRKAIATLRRALTSYGGDDR
jgi:hypothetical protein